MQYKEIESRNGSKYYFYKNNELVATVEDDYLVILEDLTDEEIKEIKETASLI